MAALIAFAFLAGAATALSPCVLPVLPVALSAGVTGGHRRPLGVVTGLVLSFTFAIVALVYVIDALGLPGDLLRNIAIVVLLGFGISLLVPSVAARMEAWISRMVPAPQGWQARRRLRLRCAGRAQPRRRLRALRRPDPRRGDHRLGLAAAHRRTPRGRARLRARQRRRPVPPDAGRAATQQPPDPLCRSPPDGDGRGDGRRRGGDVR